MRNALLAFILLLVLPAQAQQPFDFKGVAIGSSPAVLKEKHPEYYCKDMQETTLGDTHCILAPELKCLVDMGSYSSNKICREAVSAAMTYAGLRAGDIKLYYYDNKLGMVSIVVSANDFTTVTAALREKYGEPTSKKEEVISNRAGAKFDNQIVEWRQLGGSVRAEKYGTRIDQSTIKIFADTYMPEFDRRRAAKALQGAKDL